MNPHPLDLALAAAAPLRASLDEAPLKAAIRAAMEHAELF